MNRSLKTFPLLVTVAFLVGVEIEVTLRPSSDAKPDRWASAQLTSIQKQRPRPEVRPISVEDILLLENPFDQAEGLLALLNRISTDRYRDVFAALSVDPSRARLRDVMMALWLERNARSAVDYATSLGNLRITTGMDELLFKTWAVIDPGEAFRTASRFPNKVRGRQSQLIVFEVFARGHPQQALDLALKDPALVRDQDYPKRSSVRSQSGYQSPVGRAISSLAWKNPQRAIAQLHRLPEAFKSRAFEDIARSFAFSDPEAGLQWIDSLALEGQLEPLREVFYKGRFDHDRETAIDEVGALVANADRDDIVATLIEWPQRLPRDARMRLVNMLTDRGREVYAMRVAAAIGGREGAELAMETPGGQMARSEIIARWVEDEPDEAWDWAQRRNKGDALSKVSKEIANIDPVKAAAFISKHLDASHAIPIATVRHVTSAFASVAGEDAAAWVYGLPDGLRLQALEVLGREMFWNSTEIAHAEVTSLSPSENRRALITGVLNGWLANSAEISYAIEWIHSLEEPPPIAVGKVYRRWVESDVQPSINCLQGPSTIRLWVF